MPMQYSKYDIFLIHWFPGLLPEYQDYLPITSHISLRLRLRLRIITQKSILFIIYRLDSKY